MEVTNLSGSYYQNHFLFRLIGTGIFILITIASGPSNLLQTTFGLGKNFSNLDH